MGQDRDNTESQVISYMAPWSMFALGFSNKKCYPYRIGIASFLQDLKN